MCQRHGRDIPGRGQKCVRDVSQACRKGVICVKSREEICQGSAKSVSEVVTGMSMVCHGYVNGVSLVTGDESLVTGVSLSLGAKLPSQGQSNR